MCSATNNVDQHPKRAAYCRARQSVDAATAMLKNLIDEDRFYLMPKDESRKLLKHTKRLLELAAEDLGEDSNQCSEEVNHAS